ncbi:hypothetical protein NQ035_01090 [Staphylococcus gallinarum]|jgi:hypothetical protein|uniref:hypothetical protein n=1 Tax=Staphylococcus gallinarum TaxID=1293 RepID=UPI000D1D7A63|nr:hypothetical protein [Staphylococcus gallinarum]MCD8819957.1 hypothetical protein [Staphylococcus gallinarum]MCQ9287451.1 hypothetical protein [Staphylococcus gallinarum]PTL05835.1 hypothetical protein BUZ09_13600 [Staphylococcus gallinarum]PTL10283.1 hypothetical protein BUZ15_05980 [Staphylococcus gallinarum]RIL28490.1 hypothetical protein BUY98_13710 [Staphylococcus gallinarum]
MYYEQNKVPTEKELKELYYSVGWFNYLTDEFALTTLLNQSSFFITVKDNEQAKRKFYEKSGLFEVSQNNCLGFMKLNTN